MFNPHTPIAGPSRPARLHHGSPDMAVKPTSTSAPATIHSFPAYDAGEEDELDVLPARSGRKLCVRHKQMANQNINAKLQKVSLSSMNKQDLQLTQLVS